MSDADEIRKIKAPIKQLKPIIAVIKLVGPFLGDEKIIVTQHPAMKVLMQPHTKRFRRVWTSSANSLPNTSPGEFIGRPQISHKTRKFRPYILT